MAASRQECSICMDSFKSPKLLPCHHSFCYKCLEDYVRSNLRNGRFDCPLCRTSVGLPMEGVQAFQSNFYIDTDSGEKFACDLCGPKSVACGRCLDCEENLCQSCCHAHEKSKATKHHKISDLGTLDLEMKGKIRQRIFCEKHHEEEIKLVCQKCNAAMCVLCKVLNHDTHASKTVDDAAAGVQQSLEAKLYKCTEKLRRLDVCLQTGVELERRINDAEREEINAFEKQYSLVLSVLDQEAAKLKGKITSIYGELRNKNAAFKVDVQVETKTCSNVNETVKTLINHGTNFEKIQKGPDLERLIAEATSKTDPTPTSSLERKLFSPAAVKPSALISLIGVVEDSTKLHPLDLEESDQKEKLTSSTLWGPTNETLDLEESDQKEKLTSSSLWGPTIETRDLEESDQSYLEESDKFLTKYQRKKEKKKKKLQAKKEKKKKKLQPKKRYVEDSDKSDSEESDKETM